MKNEAKQSKHVHNYKLGKSGKIEICECSKFRHVGEFEAIVEQPVAGHTPTPWNIDPESDNNAVYIRSHGTYIAEVSSDACLDEAKANAEFIVRAVNSHEELLRALKGARQVIRQAMPLMEADDGALFAGEWIDEINEAITKADGK